MNFNMLDSEKHLTTYLQGQAKLGGRPRDAVRLQQRNVPLLSIKPTCTYARFRALRL